MYNHLYQLFSDDKLYDLFGNPQFLVVTQIWFLEISNGNLSELHFLYGRSLCDTYSSDQWNGKTSSRTPLTENYQAKIHSLTVHTTSEKLIAFIEHFTKGFTFAEASRSAGLKLNKKLPNSTHHCKFGESAIIRPVMHLPTREYFEFQTNKLSPTNACSVDSGAISSADKSKLFNISKDWDTAIAEACCKVLDGETGLDFSKNDSWRIGDFEFICAPGLHKNEKSKFDISIGNDVSTLTIFEEMTNEPADLLVIIHAFSDDCIQSSCIFNFSKLLDYPLNYSFELDAFKNGTGTAYTMEIYALETADRPTRLLVQMGSIFIREMNFDLKLNQPIKSEESFSWLEKQVPKREGARLQAAKKISRVNIQSNSKVGDFKGDLWVPLNRQTHKRLKQLFPEKSYGRFFSTLTDSNGESRLELLDWLKNIFKRYPDSKIAWIDPFMEDVGIDLLNRLGSSAADYLIITTEKKSRDDQDQKTDEPTRVENLLARCSAWNNGYYGNVNLKILAVPDSKLHDRMILIRSANGLPLAGYHLSNSIQSASENHPLLITPIPLDVMPDVFSYVDQIIQSSLYGSSGSLSSAKIIFNSVDIKPIEDQQPTSLYDSFSFLATQGSGKVIAWWLEDEELSDLNAAELLDKMTEKGYIKDEKLDPEYFNELPAKFWDEGLSITNFHSDWDSLGCIIANSPASCFAIGLSNKDRTTLAESVIRALVMHLSPTREKALQPKAIKTKLDIGHYCSQDLLSLVLKENPFLIFRCSPADTAWSDLYSIKLLWSYAPEKLIDWLRQLLSNSLSSDRIYALAADSLRHICLCVGFDKNHNQIDALLHSKENAIIWIGLYALKDAITRGDFGIEALSKISHIEPVNVRQSILCWLIRESNKVGSSIKSELITHLIESISTPVSDKELLEMLQPLQRYNGKLADSTPWILESILAPLLERKAIAITQVANLWLDHLTNRWEQALSGDNLFFEPADGVFTDELIVMTGYLNSESRENVFNKLSKIFNKLARVIRVKFSSTVNYTSYKNAHTINVWLYSILNRLLTLESDSQVLSNLHHESLQIFERLRSSDLKPLIGNELDTYITSESTHERLHSLNEIFKNILN